MLLKVTICTFPLPWHFTLPVAWPMLLKVTIPSFHSPPSSSIFILLCIMPHNMLFVMWVLSQLRFASILAFTILFSLWHSLVFLKVTISLFCSTSRIHRQTHLCHMPSHHQHHPIFPFALSYITFSQHHSVPTWFDAFPPAWLCD